VIAKAKAYIHNIKGLVVNGFVVFAIEYIVPYFLFMFVLGVHGINANRREYVERNG